MSEAAVPLPQPPVGAAPPAGGRWRADVALVVAAFFFGTTFVVVQDAVAEADPVPFLAVRFLIGGAVLAGLARGRPRTQPRAGTGPGARTQPTTSLWHVASTGLWGLCFFFKDPATPETNTPTMLPTGTAITTMSAPTAVSATEASARSMTPKRMASWTVPRLRP